MDAAAAAYLALTLEGTDDLLMAADHALRRELSRRVRDDLIRLGIVQPGPARDHRRRRHRQRRRPDHLHPQRPRHRGGGARPHAGQRRPAPHRGGHPATAWSSAARWTPTRAPASAAGPTRHFLYAGYRDAELGYAVTDHVAQGRTVTTGLAVITGTEDRPHAYVALTRGTTINIAYVFTVSPKRADPAPGPRPAPELARYDQIHAERPAVAAPATPPAPTGEALAVLSAVLDRDGQLASATQDRHRALTDADHLAILNAIWTAETAPPASSATRTCSWPACRPATAANQATRRDGCGGPCAPPNWPAWTPGQSWPPRSPNGTWPEPATSAAVLDARLRHRTGSLVPLPAGPWSAQVPAIADPERRAYTTEIAAMMDARKDRIGEHAAANALPWAVNALGPVPGHPLDRLDWQRRASSIGAWRELSGYDHPADPIGPEPAAAAPDLRAAWHEALAALGPADGPDVRGMPDGTLLHLRDTYPIETAWAPRYVGDELRQVRAAARQARLAAIRAAAEAARRPAPRPARATPAGSRNWPPATRPCTTSTAEREDRVRRHHGRPRRLGRRHPRTSGTWPSPPTPNSAAATPPSTTRPCAPPNPRPSPRPSATNSP